MATKDLVVNGIEVAGNGARKPKLAAPKPKVYRSAIYQEPGESISPEFAEAVRALEKELRLPVWLLIQDGPTHPWHELTLEVFEAFYRRKNDLPKDGIALLLDSPGGYADWAYRISKLLATTCQEFVVVVPRYAKSAATILALGSSRIILGPRGELGPLDAQIMDTEREEYTSALDEVQSLQRLHASALEMVDSTMNMLSAGSGKKVETLLPMALRFVADMMRPLLEKIDTVHYSKMSRILKVSEEYATRLLATRYPPRVAKALARRLVEDYPEHGFVIDANEATQLEITVEASVPPLTALLDNLSFAVAGHTLLGPLEEMKP
jgi:hypothetical protein